VPTSDTLKEIGQGSHRPTPRITRTVDRERIWRAQTPQGFPRQMLRDAYAQLGASVNGGAPSDDAEVCERAGFPVELIPDSPYNFKITTADDFRIAEALARELRRNRSRAKRRRTSRRRLRASWRTCRAAACWRIPG